jgi:hypothetical protein
MVAMTVSAPYFLACQLYRLWSLLRAKAQWNLGCRTTPISNKSVPEHKTKTKNAPVSEQNFGSRTGKLATWYVRCTAGERQLRHSLLLEFAVSFLDFLCFSINYY